MQLSYELGFPFCPKILGRLQTPMIFSHSVNAGSLVGTFRSGGDTETYLQKLDLFEFFALRGGGGI